jgi:hypothetical protein
MNLFVSLRWLVLLVSVTPLVSAEWSERLGPSSRRTGLVVSEIMFHPPRSAEGRILEFIELYNAQEVAEDLSGYRLSGALDYTFVPGTILGSGQFLVVARVPGDVQATFGITNVVGGYPEDLDKNSGTVRVRHRTGAVLLEARYSSSPPWPAAANGGGPSLILARSSLGAEDPRAWAASALAGGSPRVGDQRLGRWFPRAS